LSEADFARALAWCDFYTITESSGVGGSFIPSKLVPAMMAGTPILAVSDSDSPLGQEVRGSEPGLHLTWSTVAGIGDRLAAVSTAEYAGWALNAKRRAEFYDRVRLISEIAGVVEAIVRRGLQGNGRRNPNR
jgi:colanic acid biosynthesis glycosyl transferase WcaI